MIQLTCDLTEKGNPEGLVRWVRNEKPQSEPNYNTHTISIPVTKDIDNDKWQCYYYNTAGEGDYSNEVIVNVHWSPGLATLSADAHTPTLDDTLTFTCTGDRGNPPGPVLWYTDNKLVANTTSKVHTITKVQKSHNGNWSCMFNNYLNDGARSQSTQIKILYQAGQPQLLISVDINNIRFGDNFTLHCSSLHGVNTVWLKNEVVQGGPSFTGNKVTITRADPFIIGVWSCYVSNEVGKSSLSNSLEISVKCLPVLRIDYITYEFTSGSVNFNLKTENALAASSLQVSVCSIDDSPSCEVAKSDIEQDNNLEQNVELPKSSDGTVYNVTFTFSDQYRYIVTRHGIAIKGTVVQSHVSVILAVLFGTLLIVAIVTIIALVYLFHWRQKATGIPVPNENTIHYVNVVSEKTPGGVTQIGATSEYEDVKADVADNGQTRNSGNLTYMDLNQHDIQQTRNRPAELTVYQSLN